MTGKTDSTGVTLKMVTMATSVYGAARTFLAMGEVFSHNELI